MGRASFELPFEDGARPPGFGGASCTAAQQHPQAEAAYANGDFLEAADFYTSDARLEPLDGASAAKLKDARESFAMSLLQRAAAARRRGAFDRAISALKEVLAKRDTWKWQPPAAVSAKIAEEVLELGRGVRAQVDVPLKPVMRSTQRVSIAST